MPQIIGRAQAIFGANNTGFRRAMRENRSDLRGFEKQSQSAFSKVTKYALGFGAALLAGRGVVEGLNKVVGAASDANEMLNKASVVFGKNFTEVQQWAAGLSTSINRSRYDLTAMAATVQDTFVPLGFARDQAAKLSERLTELAVDVASFNNASDTDVLRDFQSALVGNQRSVRKYGIVITEARLKQKAYEMGITSTIRELTAQEKVQARLGLIMAGTTDAQGDAARTADSYANQVKGMQAAWKDFKITLGRLVIPTMTQLVSTATTAATKMTSVTQSISQYMNKRKQLAQSGMAGLAQVNPMAAANLAMAGNPQSMQVDLSNIRRMHEQAAAAREAQQAAQAQAMARQKAHVESVANNYQNLVDLQMRSTGEVRTYAATVDEVAVPAMQHFSFGLQDLMDSQRGMVSIAQTFGNVMGQAFIEGQNLGNAFLTTLKNIAVQAAVMIPVWAALQTIPGAGGVTGGLISFLGKTIFGFRAGGGNMYAGQPYVVGERGPEMVVPQQNSRAIPGGRGGTTKIYLIIDGREIPTEVARVAYQDQRAGL